MMLGISSLKTFVILYHLAEKCLNFPKTNVHYDQFHSATFLFNVESVCALSLPSSPMSRALLREVLDFRIFLATDERERERERVFIFLDPAYISPDVPDVRWSFGVCYLQTENLAIIFLKYKCHSVGERRLLFQIGPKILEHYNTSY